MVGELILSTSLVKSSAVLVRVGREFNLLKSPNEIARRHAMIAILLLPREIGKQGGLGNK